MTQETNRLTISGGTAGSPVVLAGDLDSATAAQLQQHLQPLTTAGGEVVLEVAAVDFIDSSGLRVLIAAHQEAVDAGGRLELRSASDPIRRLMDITGLTGHLNLA